MRCPQLCCTTISTQMRWSSFQFKKESFQFKIGFYPWAGQSKVALEQAGQLACPVSSAGQEVVAGDIFSLTPPCAPATRMELLGSAPGILQAQIWASCVRLIGPVVGVRIWPALLILILPTAQMRYASWSALPHAKTLPPHLHLTFPQPNPIPVLACLGQCEQTGAESRFWEAMQTSVPASPAPEVAQTCFTAGLWHLGACKGGQHWLISES